MAAWEVYAHWERGGGEKEKSLGLVSFFCKQPQSNCAILKNDEMGGMI